MEPPSAPGHIYPEIYRCDLPVPVDHDPSLEIASWLVTFTPEETQVAVPDFEGWLAAILWQGSAGVVDGEQLVSCKPDYGHIGMAALDPGVTIEGEPGTRVILAGLFSKDREPAFTGSVVPAMTQALDSPEYSTLSAFLRVIKTFGTRASVPDGWWRSALVVTSDAGARVRPESAPTNRVDDLTFIVVSGSDLLAFLPMDSSFPDDPNNPLQQIAIVLDFFCPDDPAAAPGCTWRCWGI